VRRRIGPPGAGKSHRLLFELIAARYERRSLLIAANQPFGEWGKIFPEQAVTLA